MFIAKRLSKGVNWFFEKIFLMRVYMDTLGTLSPGCKEVTESKIK